MSNINPLPTFHFYPIKLKEIAKRVQKRYPDGSQLPMNIIRKKLPDLLAQIRLLEKDDIKIKNYADTLKPMEINILASEYPYENEDRNVISKVIKILMYKYNRIVGRRLWQNFQIKPKDFDVIEILIFIFNKADVNFMGFKESIRNEYNEIFVESKRDKTLQNIASKIGFLSAEIEESFKDWRIEIDSSLDHELWLLILKQKLTTNEFVKLQGAELIYNKLDDIQLNQYKEIIVNYLDALEPEKYDSILFNQVINRLKDPRKKKSRWSNISEKIITKVKQRLIRMELYDFFDSDSERFNYWSNYINNVTDVDYNEEPRIAAMYFGEFVVVEFADKGNAAYFYKQKGFSRHLAYKNKRGILESELKDRDASYYITRLLHSGNWESRSDSYMSHFLKGNFNYRH